MDVKNIKDLIDQTILNDIVSVQYLTEDKIIYFEGETAKECFVTPYTWIFRCQISPIGTEHNEELEFMLNAEIKMELHRNVIRNLRNCAIRKELTGGLKESIIHTAKENNCTWMISSPEIIETISLTTRSTSDEFSSCLDIKKSGELEGITVYQDPLFPVTDILLGRRGKDDFGYVYALYSDSYKVLSVYPSHKLSVQEHHKLIDANHYCLLKYGKNL